ncbi:MAG: ABC transporter ATP-binding protein, partial [Faecalibacterium prausnitzii]|nr:ABC transporter ATP-binding protein [Faecalibacterium prausnitzii]
IARAMLKNAPVLILDEATAFADPDNETKVQVAFNALAKGRTVIMIAHRLSTVVNADHIYVLKDGHLAEDGSFAELSERTGSLFGTMWRDYQQSVRWKVAKEV